MATTTKTTVATDGNETAEQSVATNGVNHVILSGRLSADPELHYADGGAGYTRFCVAQTYRGKSLYHDGVAFGKLAETLAQFGRKGRTVVAQAHLDHRTRDVNGSSVKETSLVAEQVSFTDARPVASDGPDR